MNIRTLDDLRQQIEEFDHFVQPKYLGDAVPIPRLIDLARPLSMAGLKAAYRTR